MPESLNLFVKTTLYVIRAAKNRAIYDEDADDYKYDHIWDFMDRQEIKATFQLTIPDQRDRPERKATVELRFGDITLRPTKRKPGVKVRKLPPLDLTAIYLVEINPPTNTEAIDWMLLTTTDIEDVNDALEKISWYQKRWQIECYHKVLKSGFRIESCRLRSFDRLQRFICLTSIIAIRVLARCYMSRRYPDLSCEAVLSPTEWKALYFKMNKTISMPKEPLLLKEVVGWIATLGGFLGRKNDGEPGITVTWRGWQRLADMVNDWLIIEELMGNS